MQTKSEKESHPSSPSDKVAIDKEVCDQIYILFTYFDMCLQCFDTVV